MQSEVSQEFQLITTTIQSLANCPLESGILQERLSLLQKSIDKFNTWEVSNLHILIPELNANIEKIFSKRVEGLVSEWMIEFSEFRELEENESTKLVREGMRHEIKSENNVFFLDPPLEHAKFFWLQ
jgi:dynein heavy chain 1